MMVPLFYMAKFYSLIIKVPKTPKADNVPCKYPFINDTENIENTENIDQQIMQATLLLPRDIALLIFAML